MIEVLACPGLASVQDGGRSGYRRFGVSVAGALDHESLMLANALVGNPPATAAIEVCSGGLRLRALTALRLALVGATAVIVGRSGHRPLVAGCSTSLLADDELAVDAPQAVACLAFAGGLATPSWLGSRSIDARAGLGRPLCAGDRLPLAADEGDGGVVIGPHRAVPAGLTLHVDGPLRVLAGPQQRRFHPHGWQAFLDATWRVTPAADRMGLRLSGPVVKPACGNSDIVSQAVTPGAIQIAGDGQPIVLLADAQTTGGYALIATVIGADLPRLGRLRPGDTLRFAAVDADVARALWCARRSWLAHAVKELRPLPAEGEGIDIAALYRHNLIDGVTRAE